MAGETEAGGGIPGNIIDAVNRVVRTSRQMLQQTGREPTAEELAEKLAMPLEIVQKLLKIAGLPINLETTVGEEGDPHHG